MLTLPKQELHRLSLPRFSRLTIPRKVGGSRVLSSINNSKDANAVKYPSASLLHALKAGICGIALSTSLFLSSPADASTLTFPVAERPDLFDVQKTLVEAWTIVSETYVDPTYNNLNWEQELSTGLTKIASSTTSSTQEASTQIKTLVGKLGDPFTRWVSPEEYNDFRVSSDGELKGGVGLLIASDPGSGRLLVLAPIKGSPADRAGIKPGDEVLSVDGTSTAGWDEEAAAHILRGEQGSSVMVEVARHFHPANDNNVPGVVAGNNEKNVELKRFRLQRERVELSPVFATALHYDDHTFGYVRLVNFSQHAAADMQKAVVQLKKDGAESFILDVRNNPGGLVKSSLEVASIWMDGSLHPTIFSVEDRDSFSVSNMSSSSAQKLRLSDGNEGMQTTQSDDNYYDTPSPPSSGGQRIVLDGGHAVTNLPLVVLVNNQSASASEILAGALRDNARAEVIGDRTFGKGKIQSVFELSDGSALFVTVAKYKTPSGADIDKVGVIPDASCSVTASKGGPASVPGIPVGAGADEQVIDELETDDCILTAEALLEKRVLGAYEHPSI